MEKVICFRVYCFKDVRTGEDFFYANKDDAEMARFCVYKRYDKERISKNKFVIPVTTVKNFLVEEKDIHKIKFSTTFSLDDELYI